MPDQKIEFSTPVVVVDPNGKNKLCAQIKITAGVPVKYSYEVVGKTPNTSFAYSADEYAAELTIPVIGLYAFYVNTVNITLTDQAGSQSTVSVLVDTTGIDIGVMHRRIEFTVYDQKMFDETMGRGWFVMNPVQGSFTAYDSNGDLRMVGANGWNHANMQIHDGMILNADVIDEETTYGLDMYATNFMGENLVTFAVPPKMTVHHDAAWDQQGNLYTLGSVEPYEQDDKVKRAAHLLCFDSQTGALRWSRDYSEEFTGTTISNNSDRNDVHFNTCNYVEKFNQLILNSRSGSVFFGVDAAGGDIVWTVEDAAKGGLLAADKNLTVLHPERFRYPSGEHTTFVTTNPAFADYNTPTRIAVSLFNNNSALDLNREEPYHLMETERPLEFKAKPFAGEVFVYGLDLENRTVEMLMSREFTGHRTEWEGSVFEIGNYYSCVLSADFSLFIFDAQGRIGAQCLDLSYKSDADNNLYRGRILTYEQLRAMI